ncbi:MAG: O-antigen polymerase [Paludibacter sp.]|nr:O-antigen polymerase [Paludibacter sp.]
MIYAIIITLISLLLSLRTSKNIFAPATIVSVLWLFCILAYNFYPHNLFQLKSQFYTGISIWVGIFTFSSLFTQSVFQKSNNTGNPNLSFRNFYFLVTIITFPYMMWYIFNLLRELGLTNDIFLNLRSAAEGNVKGLEDGTSKNYFAVLWLVSYVIELLHFEKKRTWILIFLLLVNLSWAFLIMSKMTFLNIFFATLVVLFFKKIIKTKTILISFAAIFVFFTYFQILRSRDVEIKDDKLNYDFFTLYVLAGMPAFETIQPSSSEYFGQNTFRFFDAIAYKTGLTNRKAQNPVMEFMPVNKTNKTYTNVYTTLYPYFKDFGYKGILFFALFIGIFFGYIYKKAIKKDNPMIITYSLLVAALITQFMNETTVTSISLLIQILILSHLPYWMNKKFTIENNKILKK